MNEKTVNYCAISVGEAAQIELMKEFIECVKQADTQISANRLTGIISQTFSQTEVRNVLLIASMFTAIKNVVTSVDNN